MTDAKNEAEKPVQQQEASSGQPVIHITANVREPTIHIVREPADNSDAPTWQATDLGTMSIRKGVLGPSKDKRDK